jgi:hypothetical protein
VLNPDDDFDLEQTKNEMERLLPNNAIHLGSIETEVKGGISFDILD